MLVLQYKIQFKYQPDKHFSKVKRLVDWCDSNKIGIQTKMLNENKKTYLLFYFQVQREGENLLRKWQQNIYDKVKKTFNRVPHETLNLIENQGFEQIEQMVAEYEGAKS
jgi:hypothetical protein